MMCADDKCEQERKLRMPCFVDFSTEFLVPETLRAYEV